MTHRATALLILLLTFSLNVQAKEHANKTGELVTKSSFFHVLIYSAGLLGLFGHDHVVAATNWDSRYTIKNNGDLRITVKIDVESLEADNENDRASYSHFAEAGQPSIEAIDSTKENMLGEALLDVANYPDILVTINGNLESRQVKIKLKVKDHEAEIRSDYVLGCDEGRSIAKGEFRLNHADLGLEPYSTFFETIAVAEPMDFKYAAVIASYCDVVDDTQSGGLQGATANK